MVAEFEVIPVSQNSLSECVAFLVRCKSMFENLNPPREDGFPKVKEIKSGVKFVSDRKDPNYDLPYSNLQKQY